jgi:release factor glutamine methyltransferase
MFYLDLELLIPEEVFAPGGRGCFHPLIPGEVRTTDRVLDMGTGCGIGAILAASRSSDVLAVDINPRAVEAAESNAKLNGVAGRIQFKLSDIFDAVEGSFDLIIFDPPYRWFKARNLLELSHADENYAALRRFMSQVHLHLRPGGRILLKFATSGDIDYLHHLIQAAQLRKQVLASHQVVTDALTVTYYVFRLTL